MGKQWLFLLILAIIVVVCLIVYNINQEDDVEINNELNYDSLKAESIGVSQIIETLENCQGSSQAQTDADRNKFQFCSYDISDSNLTKLKIIETVKGNKVCDFDEKNLNNDCKMSNYIKSGSEIIWKFDWSQIGVRKNYHYLVLAKEGDSYFFVKASDMGNTPYSGTIYIIEDLNYEMVNQLKI